jgi:hypothetical protein
MNIRTVMNEEFDIIPSTEWMNEGLITLENQNWCKKPRTGVRAWIVGISKFCFEIF